MLVKPKGRPDLTKHFDAVEVDVNARDLADYSKFKKTILGSRRQ